MQNLIRLSKSSIGKAEKQAVLGVLDREHLGMGAEVQQFEQALTDFFGRPTVCIVNGTAALQLALQACGIGPGDEVLVPSLTYLASFQAISATGAQPVACDIDSETYTIDWKDAEKRITNNTKAIMPVHYSGGIGNLLEIYKFARERKIRIVEDAAHAFGTKSNGQRVGGFGDIACFSFDGIKNITSGEGGCIVTDDESVLEIVKDARLLGIQKDTEKRFIGERSWDFEVKIQGWRYHMSNVMAAIGIEQLKRFDKLASVRCRRARDYDKLFENHKKIKIIRHDYSDVIPHIYVIRIVGLKDREKLREKLLSKGIQTGIHYVPNHLLKFFKKDNISSFPVTDEIVSEILTLPLHPDLNEDNISMIAKAIVDLI